MRKANICGGSAAAKRLKNTASVRSSGAFGMACAVFSAELLFVFYWLKRGQI